MTLRALFSLSVPASSGLASCMGPCPTLSQQAEVRDGKYHVKEGGIYTTSRKYEFNQTTNKRDAPRMAQLDLPKGLQSVAEHVKARTGAMDHEFLHENIKIQDGYLRLLFPGGQTGETPLTGAQVSTIEDKILYASVRTVAVLGDAAGACNAFFFYRNDSQEIDMEFLSSPDSLTNPGNGSRPLHLTNQAVSGDIDDPTTYQNPLPANATTTEHEYRIDWLPGATHFYIDGKHQKVLKDNVPSEPGRWLWNNWGSGSMGWTANPPKTDNVMLIKSIEMYYNTSGSVNGDDGDRPTGDNGGHENNSGDNNGNENDSNDSHDGNDSGDTQNDYGQPPSSNPQGGLSRASVDMKLSVAITVMFVAWFL